MINMLAQASDSFAPPIEIYLSFSFLGLVLCIGYIFARRSGEKKKRAETISLQSLLVEAEAEARRRKAVSPEGNAPLDPVDGEGTLTPAQEVERAKLMKLMTQDKNTED